jgi:hypothetical protein
MVIIREPQFSQVLGGPYALITDTDKPIRPVLVHEHRTLVWETARIDRKAAAELLALTRRPMTPATLGLRRAAVI